MNKAPQPPSNINLLMVLHYIGLMLPMLLSGFFVYLGYRLFILGVTGQASLSVNSQNISGQLLNAAPGLFFAIGGVICLSICLFKKSSFEMKTDTPVCPNVLRTEKEEPRIVINLKKPVMPVNPD